VGEWVSERVAKWASEKLSEPKNRGMENRAAQNSREAIAQQSSRNAFAKNSRKIHNARSTNQLTMNHP
jgi:hypothetical protein